MRTTSKMGLTTWDQADDNYDYQQLANNWSIVDFHDHTPGRGVPIAPGGLGSGSVLAQNIAAGVVTSSHLATSLAQDLGVGSTGRGYTNISTTQSTTSNIAVYLGTQDLVSGLSMADSGLIFIDYQALVAGSGTIALVLNNAQIPIAAANGAPTTPSTTISSLTYYSPCYTTSVGLAVSSSTTDNSTESSTGQILGDTTVTSPGTVRVWVSAGTYSVGVMFTAAASSTIYAQHRHLWVRTANFA